MGLCRYERRELRRLCAQLEGSPGELGARLSPPRWFERAWFMRAVMSLAPYGVGAVYTATGVTRAAAPASAAGRAPVRR